MVRSPRPAWIVILEIFIYIPQVTILRRPWPRTIFLLLSSLLCNGSAVSINDLQVWEKSFSRQIVLQVNISKRWSCQAQKKTPDRHHGIICCVAFDRSSLRRINNKTVHGARYYEKEVHGPGCKVHRRGLRHKVQGARVKKHWVSVSPVPCALYPKPYTARREPFCYLYAAGRNDRRQHRRWYRDGDQGSSSGLDKIIFLKYWPVTQSDEKKISLKPANHL